MIGFKDWLAQEKAKLVSEPDRKRRVEEWVGAVNELFGRIKSWLAEDDVAGALTISAGTFRRSEEGLGEYEAPRMTVSPGARDVLIETGARNAAGGAIDRLGLRAAGRVDMIAAAGGYSLYRIADGAGHAWMLSEKGSFDASRLDRDGFEAALQDLLT